MNLESLFPKFTKTAVTPVNITTTEHEQIKRGNYLSKVIASSKMRFQTSLNRT